MLTGKQRAKLRSMATSLQPIFQIGKGGISEEMNRQLSAALEARELIKVKVLDSSEEPAAVCAQVIAEAIHADVVAVVGNRFTLYKESVNKKRIFLDE
ncbi:MAG: ribosome assembly RNA-binding protein YhbY [Eubacteriales bacterium]|nr:ribosome assembly RNA-binding protein YhbY [Clostridia bacterium]MDY6184611.1 ribosome assembly RNA-binding protein YhbY [Eubacteriales bacterium]